LVVLKDGRVIEEGKPKDLIKKDSYYKHMVELQSSSNAWSI